MDSELRSQACQSPAAEIHERTGTTQEGQRTQQKGGTFYRGMGQLGRTASIQRWSRTWIWENILTLWFKLWGNFLNHGYPCFTYILIRYDAKWVSVRWTILHQNGAGQSHRCQDAWLKLDNGKWHFVRHQLFACGVSTSDQAHLPFWNHQ